MKKSISLLLVLFTAVVLKAQTAVVDAQQTDNDVITSAQADSIFQKVKRFPVETEVAIALVQDDHRYFYGIKRQEDSIISIENRQHVFEIGSISKVFTATMLAALANDGQLALEGGVNPHIQVPFKDGQTLTFQSLANHTSGLPRLPTNLMFDFATRNNPYAAYDESKLLAYLSDTMQLSSERKVSYSNLGAGLLGYTLGKVANTSYEALLDSLICSKYGMVHTTTNRSKVASLLVKGRNGGEVVPNWDLAILVGAGGILSNVEDLSNFATAQFNASDKVLKLSRLKTANVNEKNDIGLGWFLVKTEEGRQYCFHNGGTGGYRSSMLVDVANKKSVIVLTNLTAYSPDSGKVDELAYALMSTLPIE